MRNSPIAVSVVCSAQDDLIANKDNVPEKDIDDEEAQDDGFRMSM